MNLKYLKEEMKRVREYKLRKTQLSSYPNVPCIEVTNFCNLSCVTCPYKTMKREKQHMDFDLFKKVIDEINTFPQHMVYLHGNGEPLMNPNLENYISYAKSKGLKTVISSNFTLMNEDRAKSILESGLDRIIMCLDATTKETFEKIRVGSDFDLVEKNIIKFLTLNVMKGNPIETVLQFVHNKYNDHELKDFKKNWSLMPGLNKIYIAPLNEWGGHVSIPDMTWAKDRYPRYPCVWLWQCLYVLSNGEVVVCCYDIEGETAIGNVRNSSLMDIWKSAKMDSKRLEQKYNNFKNGFCDNCRDWTGSKPSGYYPYSFDGLKDLFRALKARFVWS